jgi:hypothetical protein
MTEKTKSVHKISVANPDSISNYIFFAILNEDKFANNASFENYATEIFKKYFTKYHKINLSKNDFTYTHKKNLCFFYIKNINCAIDNIINIANFLQSNESNIEFDMDIYKTFPDNKYINNIVKNIPIESECIETNINVDIFDANIYKKNKNNQPNNSEYKTYQVWDISSYAQSNRNYIETKSAQYTLNVLENILQRKMNNHFRIHKNTYYTLFGDIDGYNDNIDIFIKSFIVFMREYYNIDIDETDIMYTINHSKKGSYHFAIPKYYCKTEKIKEIMSNFILFDENFDNKIIDLSIYCEKWFRYPNQKKENKTGSEHVIEKGELVNFIVEYIPKYSTNIDNIVNIKYVKDDIDVFDNNDSCESSTSSENSHNNKNDNDNDDDNDNSCESGISSESSINSESSEDNKKNKICVENISNNDEQKNKVKSCVDVTFDLYKLLFDECYSDERFNEYNSWLQVGMCLKNGFGDEGFELFNYFSKKGKNYGGKKITRDKYNSLTTLCSKGYQIGTIYYYAKKDNYKKYKKIMKKYEIDLSPFGMAMMIKEIAGHKFITQNNGNSSNSSRPKYNFYCFNGKYWERDITVLRAFLTNELTHFYKEYILKNYSYDDNKLKKLLVCVNKIKFQTFGFQIIAFYEYIGLNNKINFDTKWEIFGFDNKMYDLKKQIFRKYLYDDYVTMTTKYDWKDPTMDEIKKMKYIIKTIMPIKEERHLLLQIMATGLEGRALEKFIIFQGEGRNGKGLLDDLFLLSLGMYGFGGNSSILFEKNKTGANPEKANLDKKRYVVFREPPQRDKFQNATIKELTGGGSFSSRGLFESQTSKKLECTIVCECNKKPTLAEEITNAEIQRFIDIPFRSIFTDEKKDIDIKKFIFPINIEYKENDFVEKHKYAFLAILFKFHKKYTNNNYKLIIPKTIQDRTREYLIDSCDILCWFNELYEISNNNEDYLKMADIFFSFEHSDLKKNMTKADQRKFNKKYLCNFFKNNPFMKKYYVDRYHPSNKIDILNVVLGWKISDNSDSSDIFDSSDESDFSGLL